MADYPLIREYLVVFDAAVAARPDAEDLRDEMKDHLFEAVERLRATGVGIDAAQRSSLERLGQPRLVAGMVTAIPPKGSAMYTFYTRGATYLAFAAGALWIATSALVPFAVGNDLFAWSQAAYLTLASLAALAIVASGLVLVGAHVRLTGTFDSVARLTTLLFVFAALIVLIAGWFYPLWMGLLLAATVITVARVRGTVVGGGAPRILLLIVWPVLTAVTFVATIVVPTLTEVLDPFVATGIENVLLPVLFLVYAAGIVALGLRLRTASPGGADRGPLITA